MNNEQLLQFIRNANNFAEVRNSGILPNPDGDDGYYFVSYSHVDYKPVLTDVISLQNADVKIWYDRGLESGKSWLSEVRKKISYYYCKGVIIYLSAAYYASASCKAELEHICEQSKPCLFVTLDESSHTYGEYLDGFIKTYPNVPYELDFETRLTLLGALPKPQLFSYYLQPSVRMKLLRTRPFAVVTKLLDRNIQRAEIPAFTTINGKKYPVRGIAYYAFENCPLLEEVTVPDKWIMITENAFVNCPLLKTVNLGTPRLAAGMKGGALQRCFSGCESLKEINCKQGRVFLIGTYADSETLTDANLPSNFAIHGDCFARCRNLKKAAIRRGDNLSGKVFADCISLEQVTICNDFVGDIGEETFSGCKSLGEIVLPDGIRSIGRRAFAGCEKLSAINVPLRIAFVHPTAFENCKNLKEITVDADNYAFTRSELGEYCLDEIFPAAEKFYLRNAHEAGTSPFSGTFTRTDSDKDGYKLYCKEITR